MYECILSGLFAILIKIREVKSVLLSVLIDQFISNTRIVAPGALAHCLQCHTACDYATPVKSDTGPKMADGALKEVQPEII